MKQITAKEVERQLREGQKLNIIDVREEDEVAAGMIPGAVNVPLRTIPVRAMSLDRSKEYVMVCRSGARSLNAAAFLEAEGFKVINMRGGMLDWNGPVERPRRVAGL